MTQYYNLFEVLCKDKFLPCGLAHAEAIYANVFSAMETYSTKQVAGLVGIHWVTLHRWKAAGKVRATQRIPLSGMVLSRWTKADVERVRKYKASYYCKGRGPKKRKHL
jgi:hypothetical protein